MIRVHGAWMKVPIDVKRKLNRLAQIKDLKRKKMERLLSSSQSWGPPVKLGAGRISQPVQSGRPLVWNFPDRTRVVMVDEKLNKIITWNDGRSQ